MLESILEEQPPRETAETMALAIVELAMYQVQLNIAMSMMESPSMECEYAYHRFQESGKKPHDLLHGKKSVSTATCYEVLFHIRDNVRPVIIEMDRALAAEGVAIMGTDGVSVPDSLSRLISSL
jgi:hypothetical protein